MSTLPVSASNASRPQLLDGGVAFLTGAAGGIGSETALSYAHSGVAALYLTDLPSTLNELQKLAEKCRAEATYPRFEVEVEALDVTKEEQVDAIITNAAKKFGRIDYAVNIAGIAESIPCGIADCTTSAFDSVFDVNVRGVVFCMRAETRLMRSQEPINGERGSIINLSSVAAHTVIGPLPAYGASKHAVIGLTMYAAAAHAPDLIRINCVSPGFVDTPLVNRFPPPYLQAIKDAAAQKRLGKPEDVSGTIVFLSSPKLAGFVTGKDWEMDGGLLRMKL